jgi:uncharacterized protein (UPF0332 family)
MTYNWCEYLIFARNLRDDPVFLACVCKDETLKRNVISRAYYAAFHHAKKYAELKKGSEFSRDHIHSELQNWFRQKNEKQLYDSLRELSIWRTQCDYDDEVPGINELIRDSVKGSGRVYHLIKSKRESQHLPPI